MKKLKVYGVKLWLLIIFIWNEDDPLTIFKKGGALLLVLLITNACDKFQQNEFNEMKFEIVKFNGNPFICKILSYLKLEGGEIIVDNGLHLNLD